MKLKSVANQFALFAMTVMFCNTSPVFAEDWPAWRGKSGSGFSQEHDVPMNWGPDTNIHWKRPVPGAGHSSPIVWNDTIILTYADAQTETRHVMVVERESGNVLWDTLVARGPIEKMHSDNSPASATPITDGESIYAVFCVNGQLEVSSLDFKGEVNWQTTVGSFESAHGFCTALVLADGKLILSGLQDGSDAFVAAIAAKDGSIVWKVPRGKAIRSFSSPRLVEIQGQPAVILSGAEQTIAYSCETGKVFWTLEGPASKTVSSIVIADDLGLAFVSGGRDDQFYAVRYDQVIEDAATASDRLIAWTESKGIPYVNSPYYCAGLLHIVSDDGIYRAYKAESGELLFNKRVATKVDASMVGWDDKVCITDAEGKSIIVRNADHFEVLAENNLGEPVVASPAISNGDLIIRTTSNLYLIRNQR